ncbi:MAG: MoxR family ATPase [Spirochaetales bacterium]|nr:MoxR family ATPase [Spirochaetales bacterium]
MEQLNEERLTIMRDKILTVKAEVEKIIVGQSELVTETLTALLCGGHILLEGVPGIGKTSLIKALGEALGLDTSRIQFTPDLMPADILGTQVLVRDASGDSPRITFQKGPLFTQILLADEINRATPKTQSALLEAMQEGSVTIGGEKHILKAPFMVLATQNPIEMEGTYPLPEAQMDRFFFKLLVPFPSAGDIHLILDRTTKGALPSLVPCLTGEEIREYQGVIRQIPASHEVKDFAVRLVLGTHPDRTDSKSDYATFIRHGASPRGAQSMVLGAKVFALLDGRVHLTFDDIKRSAKPALRHRLLLSFEGEAQGVRTDEIVDALIKATPERL